MIIINSDDFGYSSSVNKAIYNSYQQNLISSTTTLVNFNEGFEDAINYVHKGLIDINTIGIHFNLTEGMPLTQAIKNNNTFADINGFNGNARKSSLFVLDKISQEMVYNELKAQLLKFIKAFGQKPTHIDSHHHVHTEWAIGTIVTLIAEEFDIEKIRITRNTGEENSFVKKYYRRIYNLRNRLKGIKTTNYFGDIDNMKGVVFSSEKNYEIMVHSKYINSDESLVVDMDNVCLKTKLEKLFDISSQAFNSFSDI
ncbi:carbohydrate deacetylase [Croceitalea vernalis]|uniref:ChbG/HpnK family deacetylase n=1 Tax=Croceitalea vernalis TaxID=3075599 RepID=A0ABU3BKH0_9FLAO|nr:ChbG/HpnK family deacetylase [Croceitalea sp. P007]MDT0622665.1 ChbG/HpnK family deacetylase [Croceitalea sp. P007]